MTKYVRIAITVLISTLAGCTAFKSIIQPEYVDPGSSFEVAVTVAIDTSDQSRIGYFGIRLPQGWTVDDSIVFDGVMQGVFRYSADAVDSLSALGDTVSDYYWWVAASDSVDSTMQGDIHFRPVIHANGKAGRFRLNYYLSDGFSGFSEGASLPIDVGLPASVTVTNTHNEGAGSLREAIATVRTRGEIHFDLALPGTILLEEQLVLPNSVTINGPEKGDLIISGQKKNRVLLIEPDDLYWTSWPQLKTNIEYLVRECTFCGPIEVGLNNLIISDGYAQDGAGIYSRWANLRLDNLVIVNNQSVQDRSAAIYASHDSLYINKSTISQNASAGLAFFKDFDGYHGKLLITNSILRDDPALVSYEENNDILYSNVRGYKGGSGNIDVIPGFVNSSWMDFRLAEGSAGIDAGKQDITVIYNNGADTVYIPPISYLGLAPDMGAYEFDPATHLNEPAETTSEYALDQNYPNPFNPQTTIGYQLKKSEKVSLRIYDINGRLVATLLNREMPAGKHSLVFDASHLSSGPYFYRISTSTGYQESRRFLLLK